MAGFKKFIWSKEEAYKILTENSDSLIDTIKKNPKVFELFDWILKDAKQERKYIKVPAPITEKLKKQAKEREVPEAVLIGVAIVLLVAILNSKEVNRKTN